MKKNNKDNEVKVKVFSVSGSPMDAIWIDNCELVDCIEDAQIVVFPGGADVNPKLYDAERHSKTYCSDYADARDLDAWYSMKPNQIAIGICRGAQFLTVINGGKLIQDVTNHAIGRTHQIFENKLNNFKELDANSLHHQMMYPFNLSQDIYRILYRCSSRSEHYSGWDLTENPLNTNNYAYNGEPEVVYYFKNNLPRCLAIQGHPEMMSTGRPFVIEMNNIVKKILNNTLDINEYFKSK